MQKEIIPPEQALEMKELGLVGSMTKGLFLPPTFSQAFRFFRHNHNIDAWVQPFMMEKHGTPFLPDESYVYWVFKDGVLIADEVDFLTHEEAEIACLKKLIEIVKQPK